MHRIIYHQISVNESLCVCNHGKQINKIGLVLDLSASHLYVGQTDVIFTFNRRFSATYPEAFYNRYPSSGWEKPATEIRITK